MKKKWIIGFALLLLGLAGCQSPAPTPISMETPSTIVPFYESRPMDIAVVPKKAPARVGMLLPLSGKSAALGEDLRNAGILAQFEVAGDNFTLSFYDTKGTADGAKAAFEQAMQDNIQIILGPLFSTEVGAIRNLVRRQNVPVFSFTSDADKLGDGVYSLALTIPNQTERIIRYACEKGAKRLAIMAPDNKAGDVAIDSAKRAASVCGIEIEFLSVYNPTFINFEPYVLSVLPENYAQLRKEKIAEKKNIRLGKAIKKEEEDVEETVPPLGFDALFIADDGNRLKSISSLFGLYDVSPDKVLFLGLSTWNEPSLSNEGSLKNAYYPLLPERGYEVFAGKFKETYGKAPNRLASLAYDAVALAAALTTSGAVDMAVVETPVGFLGTDGMMRFTRKGTAERLMGVNKIAGPRNFVRVQSPSPSFAVEQAKEDQMRQIGIMNEEAAIDTNVEYVFEDDAVSASGVSMGSNIDVMKPASGTETNLTATAESVD